MKNIIKIENLQNLPNTRPIMAMDNNGNLMWKPYMPPATLIYGTKHPDGYKWQIDANEYYVYDGTWEDPETGETYFKWAKQDGEGYECWGLTTTRDFSNVDFLNPTYFNGVILQDGSEDYSNVEFEIYYGGTKPPTVWRYIPNYDTTPDGSINGVYYVDLGLTSGKKWATMNYGATAGNSVSDWYGRYLAWGELADKNSYYWSNYTHSDENGQLTKYCNNSDYGHDGYTDNLTQLTSEDDVIQQEIGNGWVMPTHEDYQELVDETISIWVTDFNGVEGLNGRIFIGAQDKAIFIPAAGYYNGSELYGAGVYCWAWSSSLYLGYPDDACYLNFYHGNVNPDSSNDRCRGLSVRPVFQD